MSEAKNNPNRLNVLTEFLRNCKLMGNYLFLQKM